MESSSTMCTSKDFIEVLKDFLNHTLIDLQIEGKIPPILSASKTNTPRSSRKKQSASGRVETEVNWEFEAKDQNTEKYGSFSTYSLIKIVSKYNKSTIS